MSTSLQGLQRAVSGPQTQPWDPNTDPLGIGLKSQAQQQNWSTMMDDIHSDYAPGASALGSAVHNTGPADDPNWDAYFLAVNNAAGGKPVKFAGSSGQDLGYDTNNGTMDNGTEVYGRRGLKSYSTGG